LKALIETRKTRPERVFLVGVELKSRDRAALRDSLAELGELAATAGGEVVGDGLQKTESLNPATFIGKGKAAEFADFCQRQDVDTVIFDDDLSPAQSRNLEKIFNCKVLDRTSLILDIFAQRARTREGKLQIELAQLQHLLPRLTKYWGHLSRQKGGIGMRGGEGETQLETDRRRVQDRIAKISRELETVRQQRGIQRTGRQRNNWPLASIVGYTNAGKSTLLSLLLADNPQAYANHVCLFGRQRGSGESIWEIKARIGWVAPELLAHYPPGWPCLEVVLSGFHASLGLFRDCTAEEIERGRAILCALGLEREAHQPLQELSQGTQRLVLLARALVADPELLILDEPCQGLDARHAQRVTSAVDRVASEARASVIYVTHHEEELPACITHVLRLAGGRAREQDYRK